MLKTKSSLYTKLQKLAHLYPLSCLWCKLDGSLRAIDRSFVRSNLCCLWLGELLRVCLWALSPSVGLLACASSHQDSSGSGCREIGLPSECPTATGCSLARPPLLAQQQPPMPPPASQQPILAILGVLCRTASASALPLLLHNYSAELDKQPVKGKRLWTSDAAGNAARSPPWCPWLLESAASWLRTAHSAIALGPHSSKLGQPCCQGLAQTGRMSRQSADPTLAAQAQFQLLL